MFLAHFFPTFVIVLRMPPRSTYHIISGGGDAFFTGSTSDDAPSGADGPSFRKQRTIYVGNFPRSLTERDLILLCQEYGTIERVHYAWHTAGELKGLPRGFAFAEYATTEDAQRAIDSIQGKEVEGRVLRADWYQENMDERDSDSAKALSSMQKKSTVHETSMLAAVEGWDADDDVELFGLGPLSDFRAKMESDLVPVTQVKREDRGPRDAQRKDEDRRRGDHESSRRGAGPKEEMGLKREEYSSRGYNRDRDDRERGGDYRRDSERDRHRDSDRDRPREGDRDRRRDVEREPRRDDRDYRRDGDRDYRREGDRERDKGYDRDGGERRRYEESRGDRYRAGDRDDHRSDRDRGWNDRRR